jgi:hypothetical protein
MWSACRRMPTFMCSAPAYVAYMKEFVAKHKEVVASWQGWNVRDPATLSALQQVWTSATQRMKPALYLFGHIVPIRFAFVHTDDAAAGAALGKHPQYHGRG